MKLVAAIGFTVLGMGLAIVCTFGGFLTGIIMMQSTIDEAAKEVKA